MSDLIDRQDAIDALTRTMVSIPTAGGKDLMRDENRIRTEDISVIKRLPSAEPEPKWIPCSERLPEEEDMYKPPKHRYLCQLRRQDITLVLARLWDVESPMAAFWDWYGKNIPDKDVIAWMPLPKPYRIPQNETE